MRVQYRSDEKKQPFQVEAELDFFEIQRQPRLEIIVS